MAASQECHGSKNWQRAVGGCLAPASLLLNADEYSDASDVEGPPPQKVVTPATIGGRRNMAEQTPAARIAEPDAEPSPVGTGAGVPSLAAQGPSAAGAEALPIAAAQATRPWRIRGWDRLPFEALRVSATTAPWRRGDWEARLAAAIKSVSAAGVTRLEVPAELQHVRPAEPMDADASDSDGEGSAALPAEVADEHPVDCQAGESDGEGAGGAELPTEVAPSWSKGAESDGGGSTDAPGASADETSSESEASDGEGAASCVGAEAPAEEKEGESDGEASSAASVRNGVAEPAEVADDTTTAEPQSNEEEVAGEAQVEVPAAAVELAADAAPEPASVEVTEEEEEEEALPEPERAEEAEVEADARAPEPAADVVPSKAPVEVVLEVTAPKVAVEAAAVRPKEPRRSSSGRDEVGGLSPSEGSWAAQRRAAGESAKVVRTIKGILNKLTVEKFPQLFQQLIECGISAPDHVETLIQEVFEKATTQHHFIEMYADLCTLLHEHFIDNPVSNDAKFGFKRLLLNECQASFERHLAPPADIHKMQDFDDRTIAEVRYKTKMLGNIKFVGALLARKMLTTKVMFAIADELLSDATPEALESLAALLTVVGPCFDQPDFKDRPTLTGIFHEVKAILQKPTIEPRARCLLKDVLDLRSAGWRDRRPKRMEGPMMLGQVAERAAAENAGAPSRDSPTPVSCLDRVQLLARKAKVAAPVALQPNFRHERMEEHFDQEGFRGEIRKTLQELRFSHDAAGAAARVAAVLPPPASRQAGELSHLLAEVAQEGAPEVRKAGFALAAGLFSSAAPWERAALAEGLRTFVEDACEDLRCDVPALPGIFRDDLLPALRDLAGRRLLDRAALDLVLRAAAE